MSDNGGSVGAAPTYLWAKLIPDGEFVTGYGDYGYGGGDGWGFGYGSGSSYGYGGGYGCGGYGWLDGNGGDLDA